MGTKAYLLVESSIGKSRDVAKGLRELEPVRSVDIVTGPYDIIVLLEGRDMVELGNCVTEQIHPMEGIVRTTTCVAVTNGQVLGKR